MSLEKKKTRKIAAIQRIKEEKHEYLRKDGWKRVKRVKAGRLITLFISNVGATTRGYKRSEAVSEKYSQAKQPRSYAR